MKGKSIVDLWLECKMPDKLKVIGKRNDYVFWFGKIMGRAGFGGQYLHLVAKWVDAATDETFDIYESLNALRRGIKRGK